MRQISLLLSLGLAVCAPAQTPKKTPLAETSPPTETLIAHENKWVDALQNADTATLNSILADSYVDTDDQGVRSNKQGIFSTLKSGDLKFESVSVSDMQVYAYGNAAVVIGNSVERGSFKGEPLTPHIVFTDTFVR